MQRRADAERQDAARVGRIDHPVVPQPSRGVVRRSLTLVRLEDGCLEGVAVLKMLKTNPVTADIPVIMLTAKRKPKDIEEGRFAGAADYIVKPFTPEFVVSRCMRELHMLN